MLALGVKGFEMKIFEIWNENLWKSLKDEIILNPFQNGLFRGCSRMGGAKKHPSQNLPHIFYNNETWHSYIVPKEDPKNIKIHNPEFCWCHYFFSPATFFVISRNTDIDCISNSFNFFWVRKRCLNKHGCNFYDVSKIGYSRPS